MTDDTLAARGSNTEYITLVGAKQLWLDRCRAAVATGSDVTGLRNELDDEGTTAYEALYEGSTMDWSDIGGSPRQCDDEGIPLTPEMATARVLVDLAEILAGTETADQQITAALEHFDACGIRGAGTQVLAGRSTTGSDRLPRLVRRLLAAVDHPSRGFLILLLLELTGRRPTELRSTRVPVLFRTSDHTGSRGQTGHLTLTVLDDGPSGIHPDPAMMGFLQADRSTATGIEAAWAASIFAEVDACIVWSVTDAKNNPFNKIEGDSMSAAFAVAMDDIAPRSRWRKLRRLRRLDRNCAVTAGVTGTSLTEVEGYDVKTRVAQANSLRVVVAQAGLKRATEEAPTGFVLQISGAATIDDAIAETRSVVNKAVVGLAVGLVIVIVLAIIGGSWGYSVWRDAEDRGLSDRLAGLATGQSNSDSRIAALLALTADDVHSSPTTTSAIRTVIENNESVAAAAVAGDTAIDHIGAFAGTALSAQSGSSVVRGWSLPGLQTLGVGLDLGGRIRGIGGAGYAGSGVIAVLAGTNLKLFQGSAGKMPTEVASYPTPFTDGNRKVFGPFVDHDSNAVIVIDQDYKGLFWAPGMSAPDTFDLSRDTGRADLVAVSEFDRLEGVVSNRQSLDTAGNTLLLGSEDKTVYKLEIDTLGDEVDRRFSISKSTALQRIYRATSVVEPDSVLAPIHSLALSPAGAVLVGSDNGLQQFFRKDDRNDPEANVNGLVNSRVTAITSLGSYSDELAYTTPSGLGYIDDGRLAQLTNTSENAAFNRAVRSITSGGDGTVLTGRIDGTIVLHDPSNTLTRLQDRWGATDVEFTAGGELVRAGVQGIGSNTFSGVAVSEVSAETEAQVRQRVLAGNDDPATPTEATYKPRESNIAARSVDATDNYAAATGKNSSTRQAQVWLWDRSKTDASPKVLDFDGPEPTSSTVDYGWAVAISPDDQFVYAYNAGRGRIQSWSIDGTRQWATTLPVTVNARDAQGAGVTFDELRTRALIDYRMVGGTRGHAIIDLKDGTRTDITSLFEYEDTYLSPGGDRIAATRENALAVYDLDVATDSVAIQAAARQNIGGVVGKVAWSGDQQRLAVDIFGSGQLAFFAVDSLEEDAPRWRMGGFDANDFITGLAWSRDSQYLAINVGTQKRNEWFQTKSVRIMLTESINYTDALCKVAGHDWTADEWQHAVGNERQRSVCPGPEA
ncbi:WD40 repeat domain-containing protein [Rhodococcus sp. UFZ-B548]|uniref:WD40 repeat domain-containing protein n=1 Tax=Rhodococcus sp. UFZ-B548 TaxID=2742212 RepID=UPI0015F6C7D6|nr:WD40 repeat domain-containing protein [Rhodococcus sp. UFZ-B548]